MQKIITFLVLTALGVQAQQSMDDLRALRSKLASGDFYSAESILEVHRAEKGEDPEYLMSVAWLARGAAMLGLWEPAASYAKRALDLARPQLHEPADYDNHREATYALGTAIEVQAEVLAASGKHDEALKFLEAAAETETQAHAPFNLRARIWKRWNEIGLTSKPAFPITGEDSIGSSVLNLEKWPEKPLVLFFWAEWCGDCKAQAPAFRRIVEKYASRGVGFAALTRFYTTDRAKEKQQVESVWRDTYAAPAPVSVVFSDAAMVRYGVAATPTFVLVDRNGIVRLYSPTRMTEERLSREIDKLLR